MIHPSWQPLFDEYDFDLNDIYEGEVYPPRDQVFRVFELPVDEIRVVLLGQDPYHGPRQAHGLSFSVPTGEKIPPSLQNIYKELQRCFPERNYNFLSGNLEEWLCREKIFLCNASLTVEKGKPGSHMNIWKDFTDEVIQYIDKRNPNCVFLLLGNFAKSKASLIRKKDRIITEVHPSPLAHGFVGSGVFQRVEKVLGENINWSIEKTQNKTSTVEDITEHLQTLNLETNPYKKIMYVDCDPKLFGTNKFPITIDTTPPKRIEPKPKQKRTRLQQMCEDPQTIGEEAVKIYVEYCQKKGLPIEINAINDILIST
jgi:uracil-DNA glycosylase